MSRAWRGGCVRIYRRNGHDARGVPAGSVRACGDMDRCGVGFGRQQRAFYFPRAPCGGFSRVDGGGSGIPGRRCRGPAARRRHVDLAATSRRARGGWKGTIGDPASSAASAEGHILAAPPLRVSLLVESVEGRVIRIVRRSFPWQLVGFAESGGHLVGLFQEVSSGAMVWGRAGALLGDAAFRIESIRVVLSAGAAKAEGDVPERVARAVVVDSVAGVRHDLCTAERLGVGAPRAELRLVSTGRVFSLAAGESVSDGGATLAVTEIDPRRGRVVVRCLQTQTAVTAEGVLLHWARDGSDELERNGE